MSERADETSLFAEFSPPSREQWLEAAVKSLKGRPLETLSTKTPEGLELAPVYWAEDVAALTHLDAWPGERPHHRGSAPPAERGGEHRWAICQELACATPGELNDAARLDLERGQDALGIVLDGPTRRGLDPGDAPAEEVGAQGLSLATLNDAMVALEATPEVPLHVLAGCSPVPILALLAARARATGARAETLRGCVGGDPLTAYAGDGDMPFPLSVACDHLAAATRWAIDARLDLRTVLVSTCAYHDAGASAVEELAAALATGAAALEALIERGLTASAAAARVRFTFSVSSKLLIEIAKLRAARLLWTQVVEAFGGDQTSQRMELHARASSRSKTVTDPWVNLLRNTTEALAAVLGGADSVHVSPFDEPIRGADELGRRLARNVQLLLQQESHLVRPIDPTGGAWAVEKLTDELARAAWSLFQEIEAEGGMAAVLASGWWRARLEDTWERRLRDLATRREVLVGTNKYANLGEEPLDAPAIDREARRRRRASEVERATGAATGARDAALAALAEVEDSASPDLVERAIDAFFAGATLGQVVGALRGDRERATLEPLPVRRLGEPFEALRAATAGREGGRPKVFLANLGPLARYKARADFTTGFFEVGGFEVLDHGGFDTPKAAAEAAIASGAPVTVICATDDDYPDAVPPLVSAIKAAAPDRIVILAGKPASTELDQAYRAAGLDDAIHLRSDCLGLLRGLLDRISTRQGEV